MIARSMRTRETGILAAILPSPVTAMPTPTLAAAAEVARQNGYFMEISVIEGPAQERARRTQELLDSGRLEGVLSLGALPGMSEQSRGPTTTALAILDQYDDKLRGIGPLADASVLREIIQTLAGMGHRRFLHLEGPQDWSSARSRRDEYLRSIAELGLQSHGVRGGDWTTESGYAAISTLEEDSGVTAVIAANDYLALGAMRAAHDRGWQVPKRLSITGWDDLATARYAIPALSTVAVDRQSQGRSAMERLIALVRNEPAAEVSVPASRLILRESTGPAPEQGPFEA